MLLRHNSLKSRVSTKMINFKIFRALIICSFIFLGVQNQTECSKKVTRRPIAKEPYLRPGLSTKDLLTNKGYLARDHELVMDDGYVIGLTSATNPLISRSKKRMLKLRPVLFVHGSGVMANVFLVHSRQAVAKDLLSEVPGIHHGFYDDRYVFRNLAEEPSTNSLPLLLMNLGYDVWFIHKRGTAQSKKRLEKVVPYMSPYQKLQRAYEMAYERGWLSRQGDSTNQQQVASLDERNRAIAKGSLRVSSLDRSNLTERVPLPADSTDADAIRRDNERTKGENSKFIEAITAVPATLADSLGEAVKEVKRSFDKRLWNHSCDEQAAYDLPRTVEFILEHSEADKCIYIGNSAGAGLGLMALIINPELNDQLSKVILMSPSFNMGRGMNALMSKMIVNSPPTITYIGPWPFNVLSKPLQVFFELMCSMELVQQTLCQFIQSSGAGPSNGQMPIAGEFFSSYIIPVSGFEYFQFVQAFLRKSSHFFDYGREKNARLYGGNIDPPLYDVRLITNEHMSIWTSKDDTISAGDDMELMLRDLRVKHRYFFVDNKNVTADHSAYVWHKNTGRLFNLPVLLDIVHDESEKYEMRVVPSNGLNEVSSL